MVHGIMNLCLSSNELAIDRSVAEGGPELTDLEMTLTG